MTNINTCRVKGICGLELDVLRGQNKTAGNMGLLQAGLTQELQPLLLSITFGAVRQVVASKSRLQQALKRYSQF